MAEAEARALRGYQGAAKVATQPPPPHGGVVPCRVAARRRSRLHSFSFPSMSWGSRRLLRSIKVDPRGVSPPTNSVSMAEFDPLKWQWTGPSAPPRRRRGAEEEAGGGRDGEGEAEDELLRRFRDAMMADFRKAVDRIRIPPPPPLGSRREESKGDLVPSPPPAGEEASTPWNLRLRRAAACSALSSAPENGARKAKIPHRNQSPVAPEKGWAATKCLGRIQRREAAAEEAERPRFSPVLFKDEIEEDFLLMTGSRPPRRPKKRPRNLQKQIEVICPGFYLTEVTPDLYKTS